MALPEGFHMTVDRYVDLFKAAAKHADKPVVWDELIVGSKLGPLMVPTKDGDWLLVLDPDEQEDFFSFREELGRRWKTEEEQTSE